ncbi:Thioredoxin reductase [Planctomycetes bacterium Pan216]|uniref:Thioredoxin reductase n=1 Tax=Kolteria novifilia TaxID=2527975 RepID=A0A518B7L2_9BACT|nr:Thioredoxin reductase [Planctomycetes bacterium Pan216]
MPEKVIIIGSGPSGWTAALYAARANLEPLVFAGRPSNLMLPGGQLMFTTEVENFPGYVDGVTGPQMMTDMRDQALRFGTRVMTDNGPESEVKKVGGEDNLLHWQNVKSVDFSSGGVHKVIADDDRVHEAHAVIIATGARANYLGLDSEQKYLNRGVSACAVCDGALPRFRKNPLVVVGGGDSAVEEATYLTKFASTVHMVIRRDEMRASKIMQDRAFGSDKISLEWNTVVDEVLGDDEKGVTTVRVRSTKDDSTRELEAAGMFLAIGHTPNTEFLGGQLEMNDKGYLKLTTAQRTYTSVEGVFAAGDVADDYYRQAITAAGTGCASALDAERYLAGKGID